MKVELNASESGLIGSAVIGGRAMDIIDVGNFLTRAYADWFTPENPAPAPANRNLRQALVVDHSTFVRDLLTPHLAGAGWHVTTAATGGEAQRIIESEQNFGLIVAGLETDGLDPVAFAQRLRSNTRWAGTKLAALSEMADDEEAAELREAGFDLYLAKSDWAGLIDELRSLIADAASDAAASEAAASGSVVRVRRRNNRGGRRAHAQKQAAE
jgi:two-component system chemotaxis sensor kinase CheA